MKKLLHTLAAVGLVATPFVSARADLMLVTPDLITLGGTGLGAVNTVLTIQGQGSATTEAGCVSFSGSGDVLGTAPTGANSACQGSAGDVKTGASQTQTRTLAEAGITSGSDFAVFFNAAEPGGNSITLNSLVVTFYSATGTVLHTATFNETSHDFLQTATGTGNTGYLFALTSGEQTALNTAIAANGGPTGVHVGISASAGTPLAAQAGNETFFIFNRQTTPVVATPEPTTTVMLATGLFGLVGVVRRRRNRQ
jgi:hypothetical protein